MSKYRVPRTGRPMLTFFGDLIARKETRSDEGEDPHEYHVKLFRTEAPGYVLAVRHRSDTESHYWAAHTPRRLKVAELFDQYVQEAGPQGPALAALREAMHQVMVQAPELDEIVQWSSVIGSD